ncbi:KH domain-containing RNA-binding protein QKI isoform X2 [Pelodiscus sinensis]|uniref:KH domain-containing RNA-binding protein QKI isoform X2 n=1 Tax=Pelodiscus sinensis TaxID=13735 RepID=UPI0003C4C0E2|nr:protein quaking isoform X2 [Pelodiscus sinensis]|eukprot:XP_006115232.1 protein quaking isoform X2 [Pelodiscus sinensis]
MVGEMETKEKPKPSPDYLMQLMNDKKLMSSLPNFCGIFNHLERLLDEEISRVRKDMYNDTLNGSTEKRSAELPDAVGPIVQLQEKLYVPVKEYPDFNFVGRILGPRGLTAKQLEAETGCKIMVRGKGSMRDKKKVSFKSRGNLDPAVLEVEEEQNRGKPNWEHLNEDLHVLITVEDAQNRAEIKLKRAVEEVKKLLVPAAEGEDSLKKMQLMELAILNGTYRDANIKSPLAFSLAATAQAPRIITGPAPVLPPAALRTPTPAGPTIMPLIRQIQTAVMPNGTPHPTAAIVPPGPEAGLIYTPYEYPYTLAPATSILEYPIEPSGVLGAVATKVRRHDMRVHPYQRIVTADREGGHNRTWDGVCWLLFGSGAGPGQGQACLSPTAPPPRSHLSRHRQLTYDLLTSELFTQ